MQTTLGHCFEPSMTYARRQSRREKHPFGSLLAAMLGLATAYWLMDRVIPAVEIHADDSGTWKRVEIDWTRTLLGGER